MRISAIHKLLKKNINVWIRFIPLLEISNYEKIYTDFLNYLISQLDFSQIYSIFIWWLLYTKEDYSKMLHKEPYLDLLYKLEDSGDWFYREDRKIRIFFYHLFWCILKESQCNICLDPLWDSWEK
jgi:DNA repair photolyase